MNFRALLPFAALTAALAQGPMMGPRGAQGTPPVDELKAYLNLTDQQIQSIQTARRQAFDSLSSLRTQVDAKHTSLQDLLDKGTTDAAAVGKLMLDIAALRKQMDQAMTASRAQLTNFLTADQKTKLNALNDAAKLQPALHQAAALGLLAPPAAGPGPGRMGMDHGMGPGPGGMRHGPGGPAPQNFRRHEQL